MPKVDIWSRLTPQSQAAVEKSREQYAAFKTQSTDALGVMREGYNHERQYWNSFHIDLPAVQDIMLDAPGGPIAMRRCPCCCMRTAVATSWGTSIRTTASAG